MNIKWKKLRILSLAVVLLLAFSSVVMIADNEGDDAYATSASADSDESSKSFGDMFKTLKDAFDMSLEEVDTKNLEKITVTELTESITIEKDSYLDTSSIEFKNDSKITVSNGAKLYILNDIEFIGKSNIEFNSGTLCIGNFMSIDLLGMCSDDNLSIRFDTDNSKDNQWYLDFEVEVKKKMTLSMKSGEYTESLVVSADDTKTSKIRFTMNLQLDDSLYTKDVPVSIPGFVEFVNGLIADKQAIPIIDLSVCIDEMEFVSNRDINEEGKGDGYTYKNTGYDKTALYLDKLMLSVKTSSSGEYVVVDISVDDVYYAIGKIDERRSTTSQDKQHSYENNNMHLNLERVSVNIVLTDVLSIDLDAVEVNYYKAEKEGCDAEPLEGSEVNYSQSYNQYVTSMDLKDMDLDIDTSVSNASKLFSFPTDLSDFKAELDVSLNADIGYTYEETNLLKDSEDPITAVTPDVSTKSLTLDDFIFKTSFNSNGSITVGVLTDMQFVETKYNEYEFSEWNPNTESWESSTHKNDYTESIVIEGLELKFDASSPRIVDSLFTMLTSSDIDSSDKTINAIGLFLDDCKVEASIGFEKMEYSYDYCGGSKYSTYLNSTELIIGSTNLEQGEKSVQANIGFSSSAGKNILKPKVELNVKSVIDKDTCISLKTSDDDNGDTRSVAMICSGFNIIASINDNLDLMGFIGYPDRLSQTDVVAEVTVDKISFESKGVVLPDSEATDADKSQGYSAFTNMDISSVKVGLNSSLYAVMDDWKSGFNVTVAEIDVIAGNLDENGDPDTSKTNHFVFRDGVYDDFTIRFGSMEVKSTMEEYSSVVESLESKILPVQYVYDNGMFYCNSVTPNNTMIYGKGETTCIFEVPYYSVKGGYFGNSVYNIPADVSLKVDSSDKEGFIGWHVDGKEYSAGTTVELDAGQSVNILEIREGSVSVDLYVDGKKYATITGNEGDTIKGYQAPDKEYHTFIGWKDSSNNIGTEITISDGAEYEAVYREFYTIEFYHVGADEPFDVVRGSTTDWISYEAPFIDGKEFDHWEDEDGNENRDGNEFKFGEEVRKYYAVYNDLPGIIFMVDGEVFNKVVNEEGTDVSPINPKAGEGHYFDGWYSDPEMTTPISTFTISDTDVTVYGTFKSYCKVILSMNGVTETFSGCPGESVPLSNVRNFDGMRFVGMYADAEFTQSVSKCSFVEGEEKTYYAKYTAMPKMVFMVNGDEFDVQWGIIGRTATVDSPVVDNFRFVGWYKDEDLTEEADVFEFAEGVTTYYAKMIETITVDFYVDGDLLTSFSGDKGSMYDVPAPTKDGYAFRGWYDNAEFNGEPAEVGTFVESCIYYAKFVQAFRISFVADDKIIDVTGVTGDSVDIPIPSAKEGYEFVGWYCGAVKAGDKICFGQSDETYVAKYAAVVTPSTEKKDGEITVDQTESESVAISKSDLEDVVNGLEDDEALKIVLKNGTLRLPKEAVQKINGSDLGKSITLMTGTTESVLDRIPSSDKDRVRNGLLVSVDVTNATSLTDLGKVLVTVPYTLPEGMDANEIVVYYIDSDGNLEKHASRYYVDDSGAGFVEFETSHFSDFVIGKQVSSGDNDHTMIYVAVAAIIVIAAAVAASFLYRKHQVA